MLTDCVCVSGSEQPVNIVYVRFHHQLLGVRNALVFADSQV